MSFIKVNDIKMYYEIVGNGPPLFLIGGLTTNHKIWSRMIPLLSKHFTIITPDNRGAGQTDMQNQAFTIQQMAADMAVLMEQLNIKSAFVGGSSMGGAITLQLCIDYPEKIKAAVVAASAARIPQAALMEMQSTIALIDAGVEKHLILRNNIPWIYGSKFLEDSDSINQEYSRINDESTPQSFAGFVNQVKALEDFNVIDAIQKIQCPIQLMVGDDDVLIPKKHSQFLLENISSARLSIIKDCGHMIYREKPKEFSTLILDFLHEME